MSEEISAEDVLEILDGEEHVLESYVLVRHLKLYLDFKCEFFNPRIEIKIWRSWVQSRYQYHFTVSHHAHTPSQAGPYFPSRTCYESEASAIRQAISTTTSFIDGAISEGHKPSEKWLVPSEDF